jgi:hypothetical protein
LSLHYSLSLHLYYSLFYSSICVSNPFLKSFKFPSLLFFLHLLQSLSVCLCVSLSVCLSIHQLSFLSVNLIFSLVCFLFSFFSLVSMHHDLASLSLSLSLSLFDHYECLCIFTLSINHIVLCVFSLSLSLFTHPLLQPFFLSYYFSFLSVSVCFYVPLHSPFS